MSLVHKSEWILRKYQTQSKLHVSFVQTYQGERWTNRFTRSSKIHPKMQSYQAVGGGREGGGSFQGWGLETGKLFRTGATWSPLDERAFQFPNYNTIQEPQNCIHVTIKVLSCDTLLKNKTTTWSSRGTLLGFTRAEYSIQYLKEQWSLDCWMNCINSETHNGDFHQSTILAHGLKFSYTSNWITIWQLHVFPIRKGWYLIQKEVLKGAVHSTINQLCLLPSGSWMDDTHWSPVKAGTSAKLHRKGGSQAEFWTYAGA